MSDREWDMADETFGRIGLNPDYDHLGEICREWAPRCVGVKDAGLMEIHLRHMLTAALHVALCTSDSNLDVRLVERFLKSNDKKCEDIES